MKSLLVTACACLLLAGPAIAGDQSTRGPAIEYNGLDGLTSECRDLQVEVQGIVGNEDPAVYRNHGAYVSRVAHLVGPHVDSGEISEECASCIISQFARRIPVEDQVPCGPDSPDPECAGANCGTFTPCNEGGSCGTAGVCVTLAEGGGLCLNGNTPCAGLQACPGGSGDCPAGYVCAIETCCGQPVCLGPETFCSNPEPGKPSLEPPASKAAVGPTIASRLRITADPNATKAWSNVKTLYR